MMKLTGTQKDSFVLESVTGGEVRGRYSIVGMKPDLVWKCEGDKSYLNRDARFDQDGYVLQSKAPLSALRDLLTESHIDLPDDLPQSSAGLFGYLGYDMIRLVEHLPNINPDPIGLPDSIFLRPTVIAVLDGIKGEVILTYLGLGIKNGTSWGIMIEQSRPEVINGFFWQIGSATILMFGLVLAFNVLSDALQDAFDPKHV